MSVDLSQLIQFGGVLVSFGVIAVEMLKIRRDWNGSPELKTVRDGLSGMQSEVIQLLNTIVDRLPRS